MDELGRGFVRERQHLVPEHEEQFQNITVKVPCGGSYRVHKFSISAGATEVRRPAPHQKLKSTHRAEKENICCGGWFWLVVFGVLVSCFGLSKEILKGVIKGQIFVVV